MAVPTVATYSLAARIAAHTALRDLIDSGAGPGAIIIRGSADQALATIPLSDPAGAVSGSTGQLTLDIPASAVAAVTGMAAYCDVCSSTGEAYLSLPAQSGTSAVTGYIVLNTLSIVVGTEVSVLSAVIG